MDITWAPLMIITIVMMIMKMITTTTNMLIIGITWAPSAAWWLWAFAPPRFCWKRKKVEKLKSRDNFFGCAARPFSSLGRAPCKKVCSLVFFLLHWKTDVFRFFTVLQQFCLKKNKLTNWYCSIGKQGIWFCLLEFMLVQWVACFGIRDLKQDSWGLVFSFFWAFLWERGKGEHSSFHPIVGKGVSHAISVCRVVSSHVFPLFVNRGHCCVLLQLSRMDRSL